VKRRDTLLQHILAANLLLVVALLFAATLVANLSLDVGTERRVFIVLAFGMVLLLLVNFVMLQRRFHPLERLIEAVERIDPSDPGAADLPPGGDLEEVDRLTESFRALLERIEADRTRSGRLVLRAQEEERKRVARDLHDEANQALAGISMRLEALAQDAPPGLAEELAETKRMANGAMADILGLARQLRPAALDDHGLVPALEGQVRRFRDQTGVRAKLQADGDLSGIGDDEQLVIYRVAQEALNNVGRHAHAKAVELRLSRTDDMVCLSICDDGSGFRPTGNGSSGIGLQGMVERARLVSGEIEISSIRGKGTEILLKVPA